MFIIGENLSDLVQIILQITRGIDLQDEGQKSVTYTTHHWTRFTQAFTQI